MATKCHEEAKYRFGFYSQLFLNQKKSRAGLFKKNLNEERLILPHIINDIRIEIFIALDIAEEYEVEKMS